VTDYFYDGQMPIMEVHDDGTDVTVKKTGIGARGIDQITTKVNSGSETFAYPIYDTHGNMVATLARSGSSFTLGNEQSYDVWGSVRSGSSSEEQGYVANLGHRADPESFLTYMRARPCPAASSARIQRYKDSIGTCIAVMSRQAELISADASGGIGSACLLLAQSPVWQHTVHISWQRATKSLPAD
jgi:hypothetical protein